MTDEQLRDALRSLPRHRASKGFTDRVLDRLDRADSRREAQRPVRPPIRARRWAAVATVVALAALVPLAVRREQPPPATDSRQALRELRSELEEIKRLTAEPRADEPVLYLGGDDQVELVVDLGDAFGRWPAELPPDRSGRGAVVTPAVNR